MKSKNKFCLSCGRRKRVPGLLCYKCTRKVLQNDFYKLKIRYKKRKRATVCKICGSHDRVRPYLGLCEKHSLERQKEQKKDSYEFLKYIRKRDGL